MSGIMRVRIYPSYVSLYHFDLFFTFLLSISPAIIRSASFCFVLVDTVSLFCSFFFFFWLRCGGETELSINL